VNVIASDHVVQDRQTIPLPRFMQPMQIAVAILGEFEEKFSFMASMGDMPDVPRNKMSLCSCHKLQRKTAFLPSKNSL
jgi:hypothetical protein